MSALEQALGGPAIEVVAKATRRRFTVEYKRKILREADACKTSGAVGASLRREGLYSSHLTTWRAARERGELAAAPKKRGPVPRIPDPRDQRITELEQERIRWRKRAERAEPWSHCKKKVRAVQPGLTRRSASKRPWRGADNGLYVGYTHRRLTT